MSASAPATAEELDALVERMSLVLRPGKVFHNAWVAIRCRGETDAEDGFLLSGITSLADQAQRERDRFVAARCKQLLVPHPGFRRLRDLYTAIGVRAFFQDSAEYHGAWHSFALRIRDEHLPALERLAQDELGLGTAEERAAAAEAFRLYMLRTYDRNWEENCLTLPPIDRSPYRMLNDPL